MKEITKREREREREVWGEGVKKKNEMYPEETIILFFETVILEEKNESDRRKY